MPTDIYKPDLWAGFFTMVGGGAAALTGLVFVALSLNLEEMASDATHKYRSINTLAGLAAVYIRCGLALMGGQDHFAVGLDLFVVAALAAMRPGCGGRASKVARPLSLHQALVIASISPHTPRAGTRRRRTPGCPPQSPR